MVYGEMLISGRADMILHVLRIPTHRPPTHPGEMIFEEFVKPLGLTLEQVAKRLKISHEHLRKIIDEKCGVTAETALRLERLFGLEAQAWMNLQMTWDLFHAQRSASVKKIRRIRRLPALRRAS